MMGGGAGGEAKASFINCSHTIQHIYEIFVNIHVSFCVSIFITNAAARMVDYTIFPRDVAYFVPIRMNID